MKPSKALVFSEIFEAVANIRRDADGTYLITLIDGAGSKHAIRLAEQAARDLCDELNDSLD